MREELGLEHEMAISADLSTFSVCAPYAILWQESHLSGVPMLRVLGESSWAPRHWRLR